MRSPSIRRVLNTWRILDVGGTQSAHTGNTNETALATITVPGGAMGANGILRITSQWNYTNGADDKLLRVRFSTISGTVYTGITATTTATMRSQCQIHNRNSVSSQVGAAAAGGAFSNSTGALITSSVNTAADSTIVITGQLENGADSVALESYLVELLYRP